MSKDKGVSNAPGLVETDEVSPTNVGEASKQPDPEQAGWVLGEEAQKLAERRAAGLEEPAPGPDPEPDQ